MAAHLTALEIAYRSGYFLLKCRTRGKIAARGDVLEFGHGADASAIVTLACRHELAKRGVPVRENSVRRKVTRLGFEYRPRERDGLAFGPRKVRETNTVVPAKKVAGARS